MNFTNWDFPGFDKILDWIQGVSPIIGTSIHGARRRGVERSRIFKRGRVAGGTTNMSRIPHTKWAPSTLYLGRDMTVGNF